MGIGYQAIGGLRHEVTTQPSPSISITGISPTTRTTFRMPGPTSAYKTGYNTHNVMASIVYRWGRRRRRRRSKLPRRCPRHRRLSKNECFWSSSIGTSRRSHLTERTSSNRPPPPTAPARRCSSRSPATLTAPARPVQSAPSRAARRRRRRRARPARRAAQRHDRRRTRRKRQPRPDRRRGARAAEPPRRDRVPITAVIRGRGFRREPEKASADKMFEREARWIGDRLAAYPPAALSPLLNVGSGTRVSRDRAALDRPRSARFHSRRAASKSCISMRAQAAARTARDGIDIRADLLRDNDFDRLAGTRQYAALLCCNVLEHVRDPGEFARRCAMLVRPGGIIVVTVPRSYPHHADPIDTLYRPTPRKPPRCFPAARCRRRDHRCRPVVS